MEIRALRAFLEVSREENMTRAAAELHMSQPSLSKLIKSLERELGAKLFVRRSFGLTLTEDGQLLRERARDLVGMADRIEDEFASLGNVTGGTLYFGLAESFQIKYLAQQIKLLRRDCPDLHYHVESGVSSQVLEHLDQGTLDFAVLAQQPDLTKYEALAFPDVDRWGVIVPQGHRLASRERIRIDDLVGEPLFCSEQGWKREVARWAGSRLPDLRLEATFGLAYNAAVFAREGLGVLLSFDRIVDTSEGSGLVFRPLEPALETKLHLAWRRNRPLSPIAERFLKQLRSA
ncbi:LysR family transcriptional regulator [Bifidobacterium canis]|nr:LysR family transcriptional regulator [Bifidobacterium canis]